MSGQLRIVLLAALVGVAAGPRALASAPSAPTTAPQGAPTASQAPAGGAQDQADAITLADRRLDARLIAAGADVEGQTGVCLGLVWNQNEPDAALREAAMRRLRTTDARVVADGIVELMPSSLPPVRIGMLELMADIYPGLGGRHSYVDGALADQIRSPNQEVAKTAIAVCSRLGIPDSYLPMRELASQPKSPLRSDAIAGIARLRDPRAVGFLSKLIEPGAGADSSAEVFQALAELGRPAALVLKTRTDDPDPAIREQAIEALLRIATAEDLTALYTYVQKRRPQGELKTRLYEKIAELEAGAFERPVGQD
jgi:HEAT repeat protein